MQVAKWGNSLAIRLPKALVDQLVLKPGDEVKVIASQLGTLEVARDDALARRAEALKQMSELQIPLPEDYKFDREEINRRPNSRW